MPHCQEYSFYFARPSNFSPDPLTDVLRQGARELLATAVRAEVSEYFRCLTAVLLQIASRISMPRHVQHCQKLQYSAREAFNCKPCDDILYVISPFVLFCASSKRVIDALSIGTFVAAAKRIISLCVEQRNF